MRRDQALSSAPRATESLSTPKLRPFIKWAGGKTKLLPELLPQVPKNYARYIAPFLGGGALFFALNPERARLSDANAWLVDTYVALQVDWRAVAQALDGFENTREAFLEIRAQDLSDLPLASRAAVFIYLNKTCFRGLFRVNRSNRFNVPYGNYQRRIYEADHLRQVAQVLEGHEILHADFRVALVEATPRDFVYLDPPYIPLGGYSDFDRYTSTAFREPEQRELAALCRGLSQRGVPFLLSQSDTALTRKLYRGFPFRAVAARREINLKASRRSAQELLIGPLVEPG